ncbi:MAG: 23S rRNA (adenine(2503)-C(2))-methyltransferase RlmN, partial [Verrucomicrobiota bacterium]
MEWREPDYRVDQLVDWLYSRRSESWDAMSNLPARLRSLLDGSWSLGSLELVRKQGPRESTQKFLWRI